MMKIFVIFLIIIVSLGILIGVVAMISGKKIPHETDNEYFDEDGNHVYYDRRVIREKRSKNVKRD